MTDDTDDLSHPGNPYAGEAAMTPRLEDRPGYPNAARRSAYGDDLSDEVQLGVTCAVCGQPIPPGEVCRDRRGGPWHRLCIPDYAPAAAGDDEPTFVLRASDPIAAHLVRLWAVAREGRATREICQQAWATAASMESWRRRTGVRSAIAGAASHVAGRIKWFNAVDGYGFITPDGAPGTDVMVHSSTLLESGYGREIPPFGLAIEVEAREVSPGKWRATRVLRLTYDREQRRSVYDIDDHSA